jgi:hypothetical protein
VVLVIVAVAIVVLAASCSKTPTENGAAPKKYEVAEEGTGNAVSTPTDSGTPSTPRTNDASQDNGATAGQTAADSSGDIPSSPLPGLGAPMKQPPSIPSEKLDTLTVPDGTPEELLAFVSKLGERVIGLENQVRQGNGTPAMLKPALTAMLTACEKILATAGTTPEIRRKGIDFKAGVLSKLSQVAPEEPWTDKIREFSKELMADKDPSIAIDGKGIQLGILIGELSKGGSRDVDGMVSQLKSVLADEARNDTVLSIALQAVMALRSLGREDEAREVFAMITNAYLNHSDERLRGEAESMKEQMLVWDLKIENKLNDLMLKRADAEQAFVTAMTQLLQQPKPGPVAFQITLNMLPLLEQRGYYSAATTICGLAQTAFQNNPVAEVRDDAKRRLDPIAIRLGLLGKPLTISGKNRDGSPFDFTPYQGKMVLVAFWLPRSPQCEPELEKVRTAYEKYHAKGFEVIGVALDQDAAAVSSYIDQLKLPWANITNMDLVDQFGIEVVPYLLLTDAQGNVSRLFLRGEELESILAATLGEPAPAPPAGAAPAGAPATPPAGVNPPNG